MLTKPSVGPAFSTSTCGQCQIHHNDDEDSSDRTVNAKQAGPSVSQPWQIWVILKGKPLYTKAAWLSFVLHILPLLQCALYQMLHVVNILKVLAIHKPTWIRIVPCLSAHLLACLHPHHHHQAPHGHHIAVDNDISLPLASITIASTILSLRRSGVRLQYLTQAYLD